MGPMNTASTPVSETSPVEDTWRRMALDGLATPPCEPGTAPLESAAADLPVVPAPGSVGVDACPAAPALSATRRHASTDRRLGVDRRVLEIGSPTGLERRRGPGRRRSGERRSAEEGEMTGEQFEFMLAIDTYKRINNRPFPSWTEVLEVFKQLGYRKVAPSTVSLSKATGRM